MLANDPLHRHAHQEELLDRLLQGCFGDLAPPERALLREQLEWVELAGGQTLMQQGDSADSMYISVSGRLRAFVRDELGRPRMVREMSRGQIIGEMSLYTDEPRSATVVAATDVECYRLDASAFSTLLAKNPELAEQVASSLVERQVGLEAVKGRVDEAADARRRAESQRDMTSKIRAFFQLD